MSAPRVVFLGGNGHAAVRLEPARAALRAADSPFELVEARYPGFEGRAPAHDFEGFLEALEGSVRTALDGAQRARLHATGIGGTLLLALRARGAFVEVPATLEGAVLWGLETRWFPRLMRIGPAPRLLRRLLRARLVQRRFAARHLAALEPRRADDFVRRFFEGYARCAHFEDLFDWLDPAFLRELERRFAERPRALDGLEFVVGEDDRVVGLAEIERTSRALGRELDARVVPGFGHYALIETPERWVAEVSARALATAR